MSAAAYAGAPGAGPMPEAPEETAAVSRPDCGSSFRGPLALPPGAPLYTRDSRRFQAGLFLCFLLIALLTGFVRSLDNIDEIWNYSFAVRIADGMLPYRDFNVLQTPLAALINAGGLVLFGHHLVVIRILGAVLFALIALVLYRVGRKLGGAVLLCLIPPLLFLCFFYYNVFLEYSCLIVFFQLCLISLDLDLLRRGGQPKLRWLLLTGLLGGLCILSKQTFGTFVALGSWLSVGLIAGGDAHAFSKGLRAAFFRALGTSVPCFLFLFYLLGTGTLNDFLDMCVYGISTFTARYSFWGFLKLDAGTLAVGILLPLLLVLGFIFALRHRRELTGRNELTVWIYAVFGIANTIPLANEYHIYTVGVAILPLCIPLLRRVQDRNPIRALCSLACLAGLAFLLGVNPTTQLAGNYHLTQGLDHLELTFISNNMEQEMTTVCSYVEEMQAEGHEVYILDNGAELFFAPTETYHKYLDMFLYGNLGTKTPEECLNDSLKKGAVYLIADTSRGQTQFPRSAINTFASHELTYIKTLGDFKVYEY